LSTTTIHPRGVPLTFSTTNGRLGVWANRFEEVEPELLDLIDRLIPGTVFYDIGASIGLFSLYAAIRASATVVCLEPESQNYGTLELNHFLNRNNLKAPFYSFNVAAAAEQGLGFIHTRAYGAGEHGKILDRAIAQDTRSQFEVEHVQSILKMTLDGLIATCGLPDPEVLKIDVDGAEEAVLRGATRALSSRTLHTVFIEVTDLSTTQEISILKHAGFEETHRSPVVRLRGGFYEGLYNCVFERR
jgi:FkbM family methyltransferase